MRDDCEAKAIGVDLYNQTTTGGVAKTLSNRAAVVYEQEEQ